MVPKFGHFIQLPANYLFIKISGCVFFLPKFISNFRKIPCAAVSKQNLHGHNHRGTKRRMHGQEFTGQFSFNWDTNLFVLFLIGNKYSFFFLPSVVAAKCHQSQLS
jgi:hypothetical protein